MPNLFPRQIVEAYLPPLRQSEKKTRSSTRHPVTFHGLLWPSPNFVTDVKHTHQRHVWERSVIKVDLVSRNRNDVESFVADEAGVYG